MDKELIYKKIDNLVEIRKTLWTAFIVLTGGIFGLILNIMSPFKFNIEFLIKLFIIFIGFYSEYVLISIISDNSKDINNLFNKLEKGV